ncbi:MAG: P-loop NTPase [Oligoflexia bacterium]|nr:P-loop NTPase [Oligoflexia bacterium]
MSKRTAHSIISDATSKLILPNHNKKIWAIGGGKGGIGKSFIISSLGLSLARAGKRVTIVDLDLGSANLHTCLGCDIPKKSLSDFFSGRVTQLSEIINETPLPGLSFISGANDAVSAANIVDQQHTQLMRQLINLPGEYLLIDLGAGTHSSTLDYFLMAGKPLIALTPEPTSIENAYRFIKAAYFKWIKGVESKIGLTSLVEQAMDHKNALGIRTPNDLINKIAAQNPQYGEAFKAEVEKFKIYLIMNQVRTKNDVDVGHAISSVCKKYFGIEAEYVGYLDYDNAVWQSVRKRRPLILESPYNSLVQTFAQMAKHLDNDERSPRAVILRTP